MWTRKSSYGLRALASLARAPSRRLTLAEIADSEGIPRSYLALILQALNRAGLVDHERGAAGGYGLVGSASEISLASVVDILDGPLFPFACRDPEAPACAECPGPRLCAGRRALFLVERAARAALEAIPLSELSACEALGRTQHLPLVVPQAESQPSLE